MTISNSVQMPILNPLKVLQYLSYHDNDHCLQTPPQLSRGDVRRACSARVRVPLHGVGARVRHVHYL